MVTLHMSIKTFVTTKKQKGWNVKFCTCKDYDGHSRQIFKSGIKITKLITDLIQMELMMNLYILLSIKSVGCL